MARKKDEITAKHIKLIAHFADPKNRNEYYAIDCVTSNLSKKGELRTLFESLADAVKAEIKVSNSSTYRRAHNATVDLTHAVRKAVKDGSINPFMEEPGFSITIGLLTHNHLLRHAARRHNLDL